MKRAPVYPAAGSATVDINDLIISEGSNSADPENYLLNWDGTHR